MFFNTNADRTAVDTRIIEYITEQSEHSTCLLHTAPNVTNLESKSKQVSLLISDFLVVWDLNGNLYEITLKIVISTMTRPAEHWGDLQLYLSHLEHCC